MDYHQFLQEFLDALGPLSPEERQQISDYYEEFICDGIEQGLSEEEILSRFGSPQEEAARFREENPCSAPGNETAVFTPTGAVQTLDLSAKNVRITLAAAGGPLQIHYRYNPQRVRVENWQEGSVWHFRQSEIKKRWWHLFSFSAPQDELTIFLPPAFDGRLLLQTSNAQIRGKDLPVLKQLQAVTTNASILLENLGATTGLLKTSNATIALSHFSGNTLEIHSSNASIRMADLRADSVSAGTSNGRIAAKKCQIREMSLSSSNGPITFERLEGERFDFTTSNAPITGTICGNAEEYRIQTGTSNAPCNPLSRSAPGQNKTLTAGTSNAGIQISFVGG